MSNNTLFRIAGICGILSALAMLVLSFTSDPSSGMSPVFAVPNAVLGIIFVAGLYVLYRSEASTLSLTAAAISVIGYLLFVVASLMQVTFPNPLLAAADSAIYILGLTLFSWLAYRTHKMPRLLAFVGFLAALAGVGSYVLMSVTGASVTSMESLPPVLMALYFVYLLGVVVWLAWTGIQLATGKTRSRTSGDAKPCRQLDTCFGATKW